MGAWLGRRTEPRVDFREVVRVIWPGEVSGVVARAVNLSPTGILVDAPRPTPCPVGSDVLCDVTLPRGQRLLRGRVAHRRLLPTASIGMGIEFIDLSPREVAELRDVIDDGGEPAERARRVKVRFEGTPQIVRARAVPNEQGFQLATTLPFLKLGTEVDIALAPESDATAAAVKGRVVSVSLDRAEGRAPRLLIDVRVDVVGHAPPDLATPVVESRPEARVEDQVEDLAADFVEAQAVPEPVWEPDARGSMTEAPSLDAPVGTADVPGPVAAAPTAPLFGSAPLRADSSDLTEIVALDPTPRAGRWQAMSTGMLAGVVALAVFVLALLAVRWWAPGTPVVASPVVVAPPSPPVTPALPVVVSAAPAPSEAPAAAPPVAGAKPDVEPSGEPTVVSVDPPGTFTVGLEGSLVGAHRYLLRAPDGVAYNLPHARAKLAVGTYAAPIKGVRSVWVRDLPGGGTHLRFYFTTSRPTPRVELHADGARVSR